MQTLDQVTGGGGGDMSATLSATLSPALLQELPLTSSSPMMLLNISEEEELVKLQFPPRREDLSTAIPLTVIFALLLLTGCIGNICTAIVIARPKNKYMHTATNYYLFSLAISDFLFLILGLPQEMYTLWQRYPYAFGESFCVIRGYLSEASTYASILTISAFTVERYVAICHPLWAHTMSQLPRAITSIVIIWSVAALCAIPPAAELGIVKQVGPWTKEILEQSAQCATKRVVFENMFVVSAIVFFIVPMIIVTVLYILIALELRRSSRMNNAISKQTSSHLSSQHTTNTSNSNHHHHHHHHHHHNHHNQHNHHHHNSTHQSHNHHEHFKAAAASQHHHHKHHHHHTHTHAHHPHHLNKHLHSQHNLASSHHHHHHHHDPHISKRLCHCHRNSSSNNNINNIKHDSHYSLTTAAATRRPDHHAHQRAQRLIALSPSYSRSSSASHLQTKLQQAAELLQPAPPSDKQSHTSACVANLMSSGPRPASAIGNEHALPAPKPPTQQQQQPGNASPLSKTASEINCGAGRGDDSSLQQAAEAAAAAASKLSNNLLPLLAGWQSANSKSATSDERSESALSCQVAVEPASVASANESPVEEKQQPQQQQQQQRQHESLSRQHSPLSYHESLMQRNAHSALDMNSNQLCTRSFHATHSQHHALHHHHHHQQQQQPPHQQRHQLSLTHLPANHHQRAGAGNNNNGFLLHQQHNFALSHLKSHQQHHQAASQHSRRSNAASSKKSVIRMLVAVVVSFFICWVPFHAQRLLASYLAKGENQNQFLLDMYHKLTYISGVMYYLSSTINPLLYQLMSAKFRLAFKETFKCSLFKCAIFRRASTATTTAVAAVAAAASTLGGGGGNSGCAGCGGAPTDACALTPHNSLKGDSAAHQRCHSVCYCCQCQMAARGLLEPTKEMNTANSTNDTASGSESEQQECTQVQVVGDSNADLQLQQTSQRAAPTPPPPPSRGQQQQTIIVGTQEFGACAPGTCCCCCCPVALASACYYHQHSVPLPASVIGRLKGRLNASLTSLFKLSSQEQRASCDNLACGARTIHAVFSQERCHQHHQNNSSNNNNNNNKNLLSAANDGAETAGSRKLASGCSPQEEGDYARDERSTICPSAPLLSNFESAAAGEKLAKSPSLVVVPPKSTSHQQPQLSHLQANFPAHHTMLKFIRSSTPSRGGGGVNNNGRVQSLTKLSSREDEEMMAEEEPLTSFDGHEVASERLLCQALDTSKMGALIRATRQADDDDDDDDDDDVDEEGEEVGRGATSCGLDRMQDESELLLGTANTTSTTATTNNSEDVQSSVGSSPDQLTVTTMSTNPASTSSSSSLALLGACGPHAAAGELVREDTTHRRPPLASFKSTGATGATENECRLNKQRIGSGRTRRDWRQGQQGARRRSLQQSSGGRTKNEEQDLLGAANCGRLGARPDEANGRINDDTHRCLADQKQEISNTKEDPETRCRLSSLSSSSEVRLNLHPEAYRQSSNDDEKLSQSTTETSAPDDNLSLATLNSSTHLVSNVPPPPKPNLVKQSLELGVLPYG